MLRSATADNWGRLKGRWPLEWSQELHCSYSAHGCQTALHAGGFALDSGGSAVAAAGQARQHCQPRRARKTGGGIVQVRARPLHAAAAAHRHAGHVLVARQRLRLRLRAAVQLEAQVLTAAPLPPDQQQLAAAVLHVKPCAPTRHEQRQSEVALEAQLMPVVGAAGPEVNSISP